VSAHGRSDRELRLLLSLTAAVSGAHDVRAGVDAVLRGACDAAGWTAAQAWQPVAGGAALGAAAASTGSPEDAAVLRPLLEGWELAPGIGLPGRAWSERRPIWLAELGADATDPRAGRARERGVRTSLAVPVLAGGEPIAVLEFLSREARPRDATLEGILVAAAAQLGTRAHHRRTEEALLRSEERFRRAFEHAPIGMAIVGPDFRPVRVNCALCEMLGYSADELTRSTFPEITHPDDAARDAELTGRVFAGELASYRLEQRCRRKDSSFVSVRLTATVVRDEAGRPLYELRMLESVAERKVLEDRLRQSQKMEAIGRLAGGVAHDFNNLLTVIRGYGDMLLARFRGDDSASRDLREIARAGERGTALTRQLLAFSRRQVLEPKVLDLNAIVVDMQGMLRRLIGEDIELVIALAPDAGRVVADQGQIEQVVLNLVVNARDAMPSGGRLTIETADVDMGADGAAPAVEPGAYVRLAVRDTGSGMDPETMAHLFEPFFTTKERGSGTGLGLSTVYGIVKQSGGHLRVDSEVGRGSSFEIFLARADGKAVPSAPGPAEPPKPATGETILLVEDDTLVRELALRILRSHGYRVLAARDGAAALDLCRARTGPIHALVTDVVMPQMSGRELAASVGALLPGVRVLFLSGYSTDFAPGPVRSEDGAFLQKPFTPDDLARKVRAVLDRALEPSVA